MADARLTAAKALLYMRQNDGYSNIVIDTALSESGLRGQDRAFACALFYGVIERRLTLDYIISLLTDRKSRIKPKVRIALQMGIYQLLYMDKVPESAAVNESVKLVRTLGVNSAAGFINGCLRSFLRMGKRFSLPEDKLKKLSIKYSCDEKIVGRLCDDYGEEFTEEILCGFEKRDLGVTLRVNTLKTSLSDYISKLHSRGIEAEQSELCDTALIIKNAGDIRSFYGYKEGLFHVQDIASQLCAKAVCAERGMKVLDACAAPGGKAFSIAELMKGDGEVTACDKYEHKVKMIALGAKRLGLNNVRAVLRDAESESNNLYNFDRILCDLPCSGIGIITKKPEIRYKNVALLDNLPELQYHLLSLQAEFLKVGGILVYSTCTLFKSENRAVCERFLSEHGDFEPYPVLPQIKRAIDEPENMLTLFPHIHGTDGFFISAFVRKGHDR